jgi:hypothetical protein
MEEKVRVLFRISKKELDKWVRRGLLKPVVVKGEGYFLHGEVVGLLEKRGKG